MIPPIREASGAVRLAADLRLDRLWRRRPRNGFVRTSAGALFLSMLAAAPGADIHLGEFLSERRLANLTRFFSELRPFPLRASVWDWTVFWEWAGELFATRGAGAAGHTLAISLLAIVLAGGLAGVLALPASRTISCAEPFLPGAPVPPAVRWLFAAGVLVIRGFFALLRSIPEYVLAFLLLAMLGSNAWPAVLALAIHNAGILGRLNAETIENLPGNSAQALRALGASRWQIATVDLLPAALPRMLLYFFYRWETCVREAMVLGMLGISSLGFWIEDARTRTQYDSVLFYVALGMGIVLIGDWVSAAARAAIRGGLRR